MSFILAFVAFEMGYWYVLHFTWENRKFLLENSNVIYLSLRGRRKKGRGRGREKSTTPSLFPLFSIPYPFRRLLRRLHLSQMVCGAIPFGKLSKCGLCFEAMHFFRSF